MLTTIKGTYTNGIVVLNEQPPTVKSSQVLITFTEELVNENTHPTPRKAGFAKGTFTNIASDFDEPLEDLKDFM